MNFIGLKKESDRAAVIELLRQASDSPLSQPTPKLIENEIPLVENTTSQDQSLETKDKGHVDEAH